MVWLIDCPCSWCPTNCGHWPKPLIPQFAPRPQGGGTAPVDARAVFTPIVYVLTTGCGWREQPRSFGVSFQTAHRRFGQWTTAGVWRRLYRAVLDELGSRGWIDWSRVIPDAASVRAKGGELTGPRSSIRTGSLTLHVNFRVDRPWSSSGPSRPCCCPGRPAGAEDRSVVVYCLHSERPVRARHNVSRTGRRVAKAGKFRSVRRALPVVGRLTGGDDEITRIGKARPAHRKVDLAAQSAAGPARPFLSDREGVDEAGRSPLFQCQRHTDAPDHTCSSLDKTLASCGRGGAWPYAPPSFRHGSWTTRSR